MKKKIVENKIKKSLVMIEVCNPISRELFVCLIDALFSISVLKNIIIFYACTRYHGFPWIKLPLGSNHF